MEVIARKCLQMQEHSSLCFSVLVSTLEISRKTVEIIRIEVGPKMTWNPDVADMWYHNSFVDMSLVMKMYGIDIFSNWCPVNEYSQTVCKSPIFSKLVMQA